jgi:hypothetical protein
MTRRIRRFYTAPAKIARNWGKFALLHHQHCWDRVPWDTPSPGFARIAPQGRLAADMAGRPGDEDLTVAMAVAIITMQATPAHAIRRLERRAAGGTCQKIKISRTAGYSRSGFEPRRRYD